MDDKIDKVFDLLEKVYTELQDTKKEVRENSGRLAKLETVIENNIVPDVKAVYQLQTGIIEKLDAQDLRIKNIEKNVETLSAKSLRHSYEIGSIKRQKKAE